MVRVHVGGAWLDPDSREAITGLNLNLHENHAIQFIRRWNSGEKDFTFQTSGSTGPSRVLTFKRDQLLASAQLTIDLLQLKEGMTSLVCLDTHFVAGAMMLIRSLVAGMDMIIQTPSSNPLRGLSHNVDFVAFVPLQIAALLQESPTQLDKIPVKIIGGAPISDELASRLQSRPGIYYATYGMTETLTHIALQRLNGPERQDAFHLIAGISAWEDDRGCLAVRSAHLGSEAIITNDLVRFVGPTSFRIIGRIDDVINSGGFKINPLPLEDKVRGLFRSMKLQRRILIAGEPDERLGQQVCLIVEGEPLTYATEQKILEALQSQVDKHEIPRVIYYVSGFLETDTQKVDRRATLDLATRK